MVTPSNTRVHIEADWSHLGNSWVYIEADWAHLDESERVSLEEDTVYTSASRQLLSGHVLAGALYSLFQLIPERLYRSTNQHGNMTPHSNGRHE